MWYEQTFVPLIHSFVEIVCVILKTRPTGYIFLRSTRNFHAHRSCYIRAHIIHIAVILYQHTFSALIYSRFVFMF